MSRPKNPFPKERFHVVFTQEVGARLRIMFLSTINETGYAVGVSEFIEQAVKEKFNRMDELKNGRAER
jgi:hypothetical protein